MVDDGLLGGLLGRTTGEDYWVGDYWVGDYWDYWGHHIFLGGGCELDWKFLC